MRSLIHPAKLAPPLKALPHNLGTNILGSELFEFLVPSLHEFLVGFTVQMTGNPLEQTVPTLQIPLDQNVSPDTLRVASPVPYDRNWRMAVRTKTSQNQVKVLLNTRWKGSVAVLESRVSRLGDRSVLAILVSVLGEVLNRGQPTDAKEVELAAAA